MTVIRLLAVLWGTIWLLGSTLGFAQPLRLVEAGDRLPRIIEVEKLQMQKAAALARSLDLSKYVGQLAPLKLDYSSDLTYIRCQNWGGGCMVYAGLHCADIINEWQAPYTPDLSWQYTLRTWDELYNADLRADAEAAAPHLNLIFLAGIASESLFRSDSDYLTRVPPDHPSIKNKKDRLYWDPAPSAEAKEEAELYKFTFSDPITPSVDTLKTLLRTYGPVWAGGPWWWEGGHAMAFVGYDDIKKEFKGVDSSGDWAWNKGYWTIPYDRLVDNVLYLQTMERIPTQRWQGRWAYSSRIRIVGAWRGTYTVNIGVQGQVPQTVYRTYGRLDRMPYAYGERLELDVALPAYAEKFWPPRSAAKWYLQVEDNDRDGKTGTVVEWILARRYADPNCKSVDHWKTEEYRYSKSVAVPDATGTPEVKKAPSPHVFPPPQRNSKPGMVTLNLPEEKSSGPGIFASGIMAQAKIEFDAKGISSAPGTANVLPGQLTTMTGQPLAGKKVELCRLTSSGNVHKPDVWVKVATVTTDKQGRFEFQQKFTDLQAQRKVLGAVYRDAQGKAICSTSPLTQEPNKLWKIETVPVLRLVPELDRPRPVLRGSVRGPVIRQPVGRQQQQVR